MHDKPVDFIYGNSFIYFEKYPPAAHSRCTFPLHIPAAHYTFTFICNNLFSLLLLVTE